MPACIVFYPFRDANHSLAHTQMPARFEAHFPRMLIPVNAGRRLSLHLAHNIGTRGRVQIQDAVSSAMNARVSSNCKMAPNDPVCPQASR